MGGHHLVSGDRQRGRRGLCDAPAPTPGMSATARAFALGHPEKVIDFALSRGARDDGQAKAIIDAYYGSATEALVLERLLAGRTAGDHRSRSAIRPTSTASLPARRRSTGCISRRAHGDQSRRERDAGERDSASEVSHDLRAAIAACDARDGVEDGVIENPGAASSIRRSCRVRVRRITRASRRRRSSRRGRCTRVPHIRPRGRACCPVWRADRSWDGT